MEPYLSNLQAFGESILALVVVMDKVRDLATILELIVVLDEGTRNPRGKRFGLLDQKKKKVLIVLS